MPGSTPLPRRRFLRGAAILGAGLAIPAPGLGASNPERPARPPDLAVARGGTPAENCLAAVAALGGFARFVRPGARVVIKANVCGTLPPEAAVCTHPEMVAAAIRACREAGAADVLVVSHDPRRSFTSTGTDKAVEAAGGRWDAIGRRDQYREAPVPRGYLLGREEIAVAVLEADVFINMPIVKQSPEVMLSAALKNLMGVNWNRIRFHETDLNQGIAELAGAVRHDLVITDANHVLLSGGPMGPGTVKRAGEVFAGFDPVAMDAYAARYLELAPEAVPAVRIAHELGIGSMDLSALRISEVTI